MFSSISTSATIVDSIGVRALKVASDLRELVAGGKFFWLDIAAGDGATLTNFLSCLGFDAPDIQWAQRFGQAGRTVISKQRLRAVTWLAESSWNLMEVHVLCARRCLLTIWRGERVPRRPGRVSAARGVLVRFHGIVRKNFSHLRRARLVG